MRLSNSILGQGKYLKQRKILQIATVTNKWSQKFHEKIFFAKTQKILLKI
jgi:hypothetical protein